MSVITTKRAYDELEKDGLINSVPGKGNFIKSQDPKMVKEKLLIKIEDHLREIIKLARLGDISKEEILALVDVLEDTDDCCNKNKKPKQIFRKF